MLLQTGGGDLDFDLYKRFNIQVLCMLMFGELYIRVSAHVYNSMDDFRKLRDAVLTLMEEVSVEKESKGYELPIMHWDLSPLTALSVGDVVENKD